MKSNQNAVRFPVSTPQCPECAPLLQRTKAGIEAWGCDAHGCRFSRRCIQGVCLEARVESTGKAEPKGAKCKKDDAGESVAKEEFEEATDNHENTTLEEVNRTGHLR